MRRRKHARVQTAISAELHFKTIVRDRDVNLRNILHTLTQNLDRFECFFISKLTGKVRVAARCPRKKKNRKKLPNGFDDDHGVHGHRTENVSTSCKSAAFFLQCGTNFK